MKMAELYETTCSQESIAESSAWLWDAYLNNHLKEDPFEKHIKTLDRLTVESIRSTTRLHLTGKYKFGRLVGE